MDIKFIDAKSILTRNKQPEHWFGVQYNMNIYRGCAHGCIYCDSRSDCYRIENFDDLIVKRNAVELLEKELTSKKEKVTVGFGAMSDPYHPAEENLYLTQKALKVLDASGNPLNVCTKSDMILRDLHFYKRICTQGLIIAMTLTTVDPYIAARVEPGAPSPQRRLKAIERLASAGIYVGILMMPILPFIEDAPEQIKQLTDAAIESGVQFIIPSYSVTLRDRQRAHYYKEIDRYWPGLSERYRKMYRNSYGCTSPNVKELAIIVKEQCLNHNIAYGMKRVEKLKVLKKNNNQLSFFDEEDLL